MHIYRLIIALCLFVGLFTNAQAKTYTKIELETFPAHKKITLHSLADKPTYLKFWATWCQPCLQQMPHFQAVEKKYGDKINMLAVNININEDEEYIHKVVEKFGLTMPVWLDNEGELGQALGMVGTPFSVLISSNGEILYATNNADEELDKRLAMLAENKLPALQPVGIPDPIVTQKLLQPWLKGEHYVFFTATWCDWYLAESRPAMSQRCKTAQSDFGEIYNQFKSKPWSGVVNHLWIDDKAISEFEKLYQMPIKFQMDTLGVLFTHFGIRDVPTLLIIKEGNVEVRITEFEDLDKVLKQLK